jgi:hypothetical protein
MAAIFDGRNTQKNVNRIDKFLVRCTRGNERENNIRRAIEANGAKVSQSRDEGCVSAIGACEKVYDLAGESVLGQTIRTTGQAFDRTPAAYEGTMIGGIGLVYNRFNGKTNERRLIAQLAALPKGVPTILQRAQAFRVSTGAPITACAAAVIVDIYNRGLASGARERLPNWWKSKEDRKES